MLHYFASHFIKKHTERRTLAFQREAKKRTLSMRRNETLNNLFFILNPERRMDQRIFIEPERAAASVATTVRLGVSAKARSIRSLSSNSGAMLTRKNTRTETRLIELLSITWTARFMDGETWMGAARRNYNELTASHFSSMKFKD